jgi:hypothetical protein
MLFLFVGLKTVIMFFDANEALHNCDTFYLVFGLAKKRKIMIRLECHHIGSSCGKEQI